MGPDYVSSSTIAKRIKDAYIEFKINPQWIDKSSVFWYQRDLGDGTFCFELVIPAKGSHHPAFNHERLSEALSARGIYALANSLPFSFIDVNREEKYIRFHAAEKNWEFHNDGTLIEYEGKLSNEDISPLAKMQRSQPSETKTTITIVNRGIRPVSLRWIDFDGEFKHYKDIGPGFSHEQHTYVDHVWQVVNSDSDDLIADFIATPGGSTAEVTNEILSPLQQERPSRSTNQKSRITFVNCRTLPVSISWIDSSGIANHCTTIQSAESSQQQTYAEHVWRVSNSEDNAIIASFAALPHPATAIVTGQMTSVTVPIGQSTQEELTPEAKNASEEVDEKKTNVQVFVRDKGVWVRDEDGHDVKMSEAAEEEHDFDHGRIYLSPDGNHAVVWRYRPSQERLVTLVGVQPRNQLQPQLKQFQYLKPGDDVRIDRPLLYDLTEKKEIFIDNSLFSNPYKIHNIGWSSNGQEYRFLYNQRGHQMLRVLSMNKHGVVRTIIEETSETFIDYSSKLYYYPIEGCDDMIWMSERSGTSHLYLYDLQKRVLKNQVTSGNWNVQDVETIDTERQQIWLTAVGIYEDQDPYYKHLMRVNFDGSNMQTITVSNGTHKWIWSPDRKYILDRWSRVDLAPHNAVIETETGKLICMLEAGNLYKLEAAGWTVPERFVAPGRDGKTLIYGIIIRPAKLDPSKKYPVIEEIYAGPTNNFVPKAFATLLRQHELAELGFIVVQIDGMGTNWRNKTFHNYCYKNLKDAGLPDRIAWMRHAAESRPWMDLTRVGIYGSSAGGQNAMAALLWHGDFYKAAVADCGCHDNRMDKIWWNELWMGWPVDQSYEDSSNAVHANRLQGALMLVIGAMDDNVDPASTMQVVHALNQARKDYDLLVMPNLGHAVMSVSPYAQRRQRDFFVRHLMGREPPNRNIQVQDE